MPFGKEEEETKDKRHGEHSESEGGSPRGRDGPTIQGQKQCGDGDDEGEGAKEVNPFDLRPESLSLACWVPVFLALGRGRWWNSEGESHDDDSKSGYGDLDEEGPTPADGVGKDTPERCSGRGTHCKHNALQALPGPAFTERNDI